MIFKIEEKKDVIKFFEKQKEFIKNSYKEWKNNLILNPYKENDGVLTNKKFNNFKIYKKRFGNIRVLFVINKEIVTIFIIKADNRGQIYKD